MEANEGLLAKSQNNIGNDEGVYVEILSVENPSDDDQLMSRVLPISSIYLTLYRVVIVFRLIVLVFFLQYRCTHPVNDAYALWLVSIICEVWFAFSWLLDQFPKWSPIERETYLERLALRYERDGEPLKLAPIDVFVTTLDPSKESPLLTVNTVLSILSVDYPVGKVSCYVSDDGCSMVTFESLSETALFAKKWVPFCKKHNIEPRAPEFYFSQTVDYVDNNVQPSFFKEHKAIMKREYDEFKVRINALVAKAQKKMPEEETTWPGNNPRDHPGIIQVFMGQFASLDTDGNELPSLVYVSREKRLGFQHHKKAGALNALARVSAVLTNGAFVLNVDCDHYFNNNKALKEAMCYMMDPAYENKTCYVQFPQRFYGIDWDDQYNNRNSVFYDSNLKGLDGIQGPFYVGTGCCINRKALYGYDPILTEVKKDVGGGDDNISLHMSQKPLDKGFGQSSLFVDPIVMETWNPTMLLKEALNVISCDYEKKTEWGKEIGWIYGSVNEDIMTGFKMHTRGWISKYRMPLRPAFKGSAPINFPDRLKQARRWALGSIEMLLGRHCPIWYGYHGKLRFSQRLAYVNNVVYPLTSLPLLAYCALPAICLLTGKSTAPEITDIGGMWFIPFFVSFIVTIILELKWSGVSLLDWWRNEQFWVIGGTSAHLFAVFQGFYNFLAEIDSEFTITAKVNVQNVVNLSELYIFKWSFLLIPPTIIIIVNLVGIVFGVSSAIINGYESWGPLYGKLFFAIWSVAHLYPFLTGLLGPQNRTPTTVILWLIVLASILSLLWIRVDPL